METGKDFMGTFTRFSPGGGMAAVATDLHLLLSVDSWAMPGGKLSNYQIINLSNQQLGKKRARWAEKKRGPEDFHRDVYTFSPRGSHGRGRH